MMVVFQNYLQAISGISRTEEVCPNIRDNIMGIALQFQNRDRKIDKRIVFIHSTTFRRKKCNLRNITEIVFFVSVVTFSNEFVAHFKKLVKNIVS